jgi:predicted transcriptional regulator
MLDAQIVVRVEKQTKREVERIARKTKRKPGAIVRVALRDWLDRQAAS